jgi:hypothetical protein
VAAGLLFGESLARIVMRTSYREPASIEPVGTV